MSDYRLIAMKRGWLALVLLPLAVMLACGGGEAPAPEEGMEMAMEVMEVDDARLLAAHRDSDNWLTYGHGYNNQRYSELVEINRENVDRLVPRWIYQTGILGTFETNPLVVDGVMYFSTPYNHVVAVNAATGDLIWRYEHQLRTETSCCGPVNRGVAVGYGRVYMITVDARLVALDRRTGAIVWDVAVADPNSGTPESTEALLDSDVLKGNEVKGWTGFSGNMPPLVYDGMVIVGVTGAGYGLVLQDTESNSLAVVGMSGTQSGLRAFVTAYDAQSGNQIWRWYSTPEQGWEGAFVTRTAAGDVLPRDIAGEKSAMARFPDAWKRGGGSIWSHPALDPELGLLYVGTGNPAPAMDDATRPGDNLYTVCLVALDVHTGELKWYFQQVPHDLWNRDVTSPPVLFDLRYEGRTVPVVSEAAKTGWLYVHDRRTGELLLRSEPFVPQMNTFSRPTREGVWIAPGSVGGGDWPPSAYSPQTGWIYEAANHYPMRYTVHDVPPEDGNPARTYTSAGESDFSPEGRLSAINPETGKIEWQVETDGILVSGVAATAGGLVFTGEATGYFTARDARDGRLLWRFQTGAAINAPPITYQAGGRQFVAIAAGGHQKFQTPLGDTVIAFALPD